MVEESQVFSPVGRNQLDRAIASRNFDVVVKSLGDIADVIIVGSVTTTQRSNPTPQTFLSTGSASLRVIDAKVERILANASAENEKSGASSYEVASLKGIEAVGRRIATELKERMDESLR